MLSRVTRLKSNIVTGKVRFMSISTSEACFTDVKHKNSLKTGIGYATLLLDLQIVEQDSSVAYPN